jgi:hypothetical protein
MIGEKPGTYARGLLPIVRRRPCSCGVLVGFAADFCIRKNGRELAVGCDHAIGFARSDLVLPLVTAFLAGVG